jgi:hypothetical protein
MHVIIKIIEILQIPRDLIPKICMMDFLHIAFEGSFGQASGTDPTAQVDFAVDPVRNDKITPGSEDFAYW